MHGYFIQIKGKLAFDLMQLFMFMNIILYLDAAKLFQN